MRLKTSTSNELPGEGILIIQRFSWLSRRHQTSDMQWTYDILGTTADYNPPNVQARITSTSANSARRTVKQKKNYVLENLKLQSTAVSSPYKGVRLVSRSAR